MQHIQCSIHNQCSTPSAAHPVQHTQCSTPSAANTTSAAYTTSAANTTSAGVHQHHAAAELLLFVQVTFDSFRAGAACGYWPATLASISRVTYGKIVEVVDSIYNTGQYLQRLGTGGALVAVLFHLTSHNALSLESPCEHWQLQVNKSMELKVEFEQLALTFPDVLCVAVDSTKTGNSLTAEPESESAQQFPFVKLFLDGAELEVENCDLKTSIAKHSAAKQKTSMFARINQDDYTAALGRKDTSSGVG